MAFFTTPGEVNGTFVIDGVVGDYLCAKYGDLKDAPLTVRVEKNRVTEATLSLLMALARQTGVEAARVAACPPLGPPPG